MAGCLVRGFHVFQQWIRNRSLHLFSEGGWNLYPLYGTLRHENPFNFVPVLNDLDGAVYCGLHMGELNTIHGQADFIVLQECILSKSLFYEVAVYCFITLAKESLPHLTLRVITTRGDGTEGA